MNDEGGRERGKGRGSRGMLIAVLTEAGDERVPCSERGIVLVVVIWLYFDIRF